MRTSKKTRAIDNIGSAVQDCLQKFRIILRIILQISILDQDDITLCFGESSPQGCSFSHILGMAADFQVRRLEVFQDLGSSILRTVVDDDDFLL